MPRNPFDSIFFISVPENFTHTIGDFSLDPGILLPVEAKPGEKELDLASVSWEMIISGMLRVITYDPQHEHASYYRNFVQAVRPNIESELVTAGIEKAKQQNYDMAEEIFQTATAVTPGSVAPVYNLALVHETRARTYAKLGDKELTALYMQKAETAFRHSCSITPKSPQALQAAAEFFTRIGDQDAALETFEELKSIQDTPQTREIIAELRLRKSLDRQFQAAYTAIVEGNETEALRLIDEFIEKETGVWTAWFLRGWAERRQGNFTTAEENFRTALELGSAQPDLLNELAICTMENGKFDESRGYLEQALSIEPDNTKILSNLGIVALKQGLTDEAFHRFEEVLKLDPQDPIARNYLDFLSGQQ